MNQNVVDYLQENKGKFSQEVLISALQKANYSRLDIEAGIQVVYAELAVPIPQSSMSSSFWNFKSKKIYTKASEKFGDFFLGLVSPVVLWLIALVIPIVGHLIWFGFAIFAAIYLFNRRRFISYGLILNFIGIPVFAGFTILMLVNGF